jgi:hypothetical protein
MMVLYNAFGKQFVCERKNWKTCPDHRNYFTSPPNHFTVSSLNIPEDAPMYSMDGPVFTGEEFLKMREQGKFTVPIRLSLEEVEECDWDTLNQTLARMVAGEHYTRNDIVVFEREKIVNNVVYFNVTYFPYNSLSG